MLVKTQDGAEVEVDLDAYNDAIKEHYSSKGVLLKTQAEIDQEKEQIASETTKSVHGAWEKRASELFGEKRPDGVKGLDWLGQKVESLKNPKQEVKHEEPEKPEPEKSSVHNDVNKARLSTLEKELSDLREAQAAKEAAAAQKAVGSAIKSATRQLPVDGETDEEKAGKVQTLEILLREKYDMKLEDEYSDLVPYDKKTGEVLINPKTTKPYTVNELVQRDWPYLLNQGKKADPKIEGTGTHQKQIERTKSGDEGIIAVSEEAIIEEARKRGLIAGSEERRKFVNASLELSGLPVPK